MDGEIEVKTIYFVEPGNHNTEQVLRLSRRRAEELGIKTIVISSTTGSTAVKAIDYFKGMKVIVVSRVANWQGPDTQDFTEENKRAVQSKGGILLTTTHTFGGVDQAIRDKFKSYGIGDIIANTLRIFSQGMKVICEITLMAADGGLVSVDEDIIAIAGTDQGVDTAVVIRPVNSNRFFNLRIKEILCKPYSCD